MLEKGLVLCHSLGRLPWKDTHMDGRTLFSELYNASSEADVASIIRRSSPMIGHPSNWFPLGNNEGNFGIIENQQSSPIAALIEKITNSIDAILMRRCFELGVDPRSSDAPANMGDAVEIFFGRDSDSWYVNWNLSGYRHKQAEEIQLLADGPRMETSLVIYDNGEGQHPEEFENTFLSLLKGNKSDIPFVQGKYNMGGTGALVHCGKRRYQLIASKRYDGIGDFGYTIVREHPLSEEEEKKLREGSLKNTWYEYLKIEGSIPGFPIDTLDLGLKDRLFTTGTVIKLYSYNLPPGSRSVISRDLNLSINEFLFQPALPICTIDKAERYPNDRNLMRDLFGLKRRLEEDDSRYVEEFFSEELDYSEVGRAKVTCYVFNNKVDGRSAKETRETISREFFKNNMSVLFSINGQVHGHYTSEFITRSLRMPLLKNHLLVHVDCINMTYAFWKELFMASRDRLKGSVETHRLRELLSATLSKGRLQEIYNRRKNAISIDTGDTSDLLKAFSKSMPLDSDLFKLIKNTFKIDLPKAEKAKRRKKTTKKEEARNHFDPKRFPSIFKLHNAGTEDKPAARIPIGGMRSVKFSTDVENQYSDRTDEPGTLSLSLLSFRPNDTKGGNRQGSPKELSDVINVRKSSPDKGTIRIGFEATEELMIDDMVQISAALSGPGEEFEERFWVQIVDKERPKKDSKNADDFDQDNWGLPQYKLVYKEKREGISSWDELESSGIEMDYPVIMHPFVEGDQLDTIYINMDSSVLKTYKSKIRSITEEQMELADKKYISSVYFHTLFLFSIAKQKKYDVSKDDKEIELSDFLKDIFSSYYTEFLLNFGTEELMAALSI